MIFSGVEMGGEGVFEGAAEEGFEDLFEGMAAGFVFGLTGGIDDFAAGLATAEVAFFFENMHHSADGHGGGGRGDGLDDLIDGGFSKGEDGVHDLSFAAAESVAWVFCHLHSPTGNIKCQYFNLSAERGKVMC